MTENNIITLNSLQKLLDAGFKIYRIPPGYKKAIHHLRSGKWGVKWDGFEKFNSAGDAENKLHDLLKDPKSVEIK